MGVKAKTSREPLHGQAGLALRRVEGVKKGLFAPADLIGHRWGPVGPPIIHLQGI